MTLPLRVLALVSCTYLCASIVHAAQIHARGTPQPSTAFPRSKVSLFWKGDGELKRLANTDFLLGHIFTLRERIDGYRGLLKNATNEMEQLSDLTQWHKTQSGVTTTSINKWKSRYDDGKVKLALLKKTTQLLGQERTELQAQVNRTRVRRIGTTEQILRHELVSMGGDARARSELATTLALQKAMKHVTEAYTYYVHMLQTILGQNATALKGIDGDLIGFQENVKKISDEMRVLDSESSRLRRLASKHLRAAIRERENERRHVHEIHRLNAWIKDEERRLAHAQEMYRQAKAAYDK